MRSVRHFILILACLGLAVPAAGQDAPWSPPEPTARSRDWIKLNSGEWLCGRIQLMRDSELEFESEELDDLKLDWEDIAEIRSPRMLSYAFLNGLVVTGTSVLKDGVVQVSGFGAVHAFGADEVHAIIEGHLKESNYWSMLASSNLVIRQGNTDQAEYNSFLQIRRETTGSRLNFQYRGNYGKLDGNETVNNHRFNLDHNLFLSRHFFATPVIAEVFTDRYQNTDRRTSVSAGAGYYILRDGTDWWVSAYGGFQNTRYVSVQPGQDTHVDNATVTAGTKLETDLTDAVELDAEYSMKLSLGKDDTVLHHLFVRLSFDLMGDWLDFNASLNWDHNRSPKTNADGVTPKKDDLVMTYGLEIEF
jgi:hypothetical protein